MSDAPRVEQAYADLDMHRRQFPAEIARAMPINEFEAWFTERRRLYNAVWQAEHDFYLALSADMDTQEITS